MSIAEAIRARAEDVCGERTVSEVRIGLTYTCVALEDGSAGVAYTYPQTDRGGCSRFRGMGSLAGKKARDLVPLLESTDRTEAAVALAVVNALADCRSIQGTTGDVLDAVEIRPTDRVGMIGLFRPLLPRLRKTAAAVEIFDEQPEKDEEVMPAEQAHDALQKCDIALVSSTSIINHTLDDLFPSLVTCRDVVLLGSSTPLLPEAFTGTPVTMLSGITINDPAGMLQVVGEGRGTRSFKPFVTKWNIPLKKAVS